MRSVDVRLLTRVSSIFRRDETMPAQDTHIAFPARVGKVVLSAAHSATHAVAKVMIISIVAGTFSTQATIVERLPGENRGGGAITMHALDPETDDGDVVPGPAYWDRVTDYVARLGPLVDEPIEGEPDPVI